MHSNSDRTDTTGKRFRFMQKPLVLLLSYNASVRAAEPGRQREYEKIVQVAGAVIWQRGERPSVDARGSAEYFGHRISDLNLFFCLALKRAKG